MNSLLKSSHLPDLANFKATDVKPAIDKIIEDAEHNLQQTIDKNTASWGALLKLEEDDEKITEVLSSISHMNSVCNTPELRKDYEYTISKLTEFHTKVTQNKDLYLLYKQVQKQYLNKEQAQAVKKAIRSFEVAGVSLDESKRLRLKEISQEQAKLSSSFENNVLDASMDWIYTTSDINKLNGLPDANIQAAIEKAKQKKSDDIYALGIDIPTYLAIMQQADDRNLREMFYRAYCTKASKEADNKKFDNDSNIARTLELRIEKSQILDFDNYAERSLFTKMAETPEQVLELLNSLLKKSKSQAHTELQELKEFAHTLGFEDEMQSWDTAYFSEKLKK
jgi:oligopeptidase A